MKKIHILLVENRDEEIEFFTESLEESGLSFFCNTARSIKDALMNVKHNVFDAIFVDISLLYSEPADAIQKIKSLQNTAIIFFSTTLMQQSKSENVITEYIQLPHSVSTMAQLLKNIFIDNEVHHQPASR